MPSLKPSVTITLDADTGEAVPYNENSFRDTEDPSFYRESPAAVKQYLKEVIAEILPEYVNSNIGIYYSSKPLKKSGELIMGQIKICSKELVFFSGHEVIIELDQDFVDAWLNPNEDYTHLLKAFIHHLLCSVFFDNEKEKWNKVLPDISGYASNYKYFGDWQKSLSKVQNSLGGKQTDLFEEV